MGEAAGAITGAVTAVAGVTTGAIAANKAKKEAQRQDDIAGRTTSSIISFRS